MLKGEDCPASFTGQDRAATGLQRSLAGDMQLFSDAMSREGRLCSLTGCGWACPCRSVPSAPFKPQGRCL